MAGRFTRRGAVITAGGSGIDAATAGGSVQEGAAVVIADLSGKRAAARPDGRARGYRPHRPVSVSDEASFLAGEAIRVDGGVTARTGLPALSRFRNSER